LSLKRKNKRIIIWSIKGLFYLCKEALGAAYLAGLAVGYWEGQEEIATQWSKDKAFSRDMVEEDPK
jgi:glycerol kinase